MARRRIPVKKVRKGSIYFADRRFYDFQVYRKIVSRQNSKNSFKENTWRFPIRDAPITTTLLVSKHETLFGREYVQVMVANSDQEVTLGYMHLGEFLKVICGEPDWIIIE